MRPERRGGVGYVQRRWCLGLLSGPAPRWLRRPSPGVFRNAGPRSHVIRGEHLAECVRDRGGWGAAAGRGRGWGHRCAPSRRHVTGLRLFCVRPFLGTLVTHHRQQVARGSRGGILNSGVSTRFLLDLEQVSQLRVPF